MSQVFQTFQNFLGEHLKIVKIGLYFEKNS